MSCFDWKDVHCDDYKNHAYAILKLRQNVSIWSLIASFPSKLARKGEVDESEKIAHLAPSGTLWPYVALIAEK